MNHADVKQNLADYLEGDLSLELRARVDAHLDGCSECARDVDEMQQTIRLLRTLPEPETPPMIAANVMRRIRAGETQPNWFGRIARAFSGAAEPSFVLPASAIAVAALVAMVVQDPSSLDRFRTSPGAETTDPSIDGAAFSSGRSEFERQSVQSGIAGLGLNLRWPFEGAVGSDTRDSSSFASRPTRSGTPTADAAGSEVASGPLRFRVEFDGSASNGTLRVTPAAPTPPPLASLASRSAPSWRNDPMPRPSMEDRFAASGGSQAGWARRVAQPTRGLSLGSGAESSGGEDPRDEWLARGLESPADFARFLAAKTLAEHELWVSRLARRAEEQGVLDELVAALRASGDVSAAILSDDFAAHAETHVDPTPTQEWARDWNSPSSR